VQLEIHPLASERAGIVRSWKLQSGREPGNWRVAYVYEHKNESVCCKLRSWGLEIPWGRAPLFVVSPTLMSPVVAVHGQLLVAALQQCYDPASSYLHTPIQLHAAGVRARSMPFANTNMWMSRLSGAILHAETSSHLWCDGSVTGTLCANQ
jgi:hypothetical protein